MQDFDYWDDNYWGSSQLYRGRPVRDDSTSMFYVKLPVPGSVVTIVTTSGAYADLLAEMLANCGIKVDSTDRQPAEGTDVAGALDYYVELVNGLLASWGPSEYTKNEAQQVLEVLESAAGFKATKVIK